MAGVVPEQEASSIPGMDYIYVTETKIKYINTDYKKMSAKIYDHNCDVKLKVSDTTFKAHKDILSESSDYFSAMFSHDMKEKEQTVIELLDISPEGFSVTLDYFYHGHVTIDCDIVADVLEAARFFHVEWLIRVCCEYLVRHLSIDDYEEVLHLAELYALGNLKPSILKFISENILKLTADTNSGFLKRLSSDLLLEFLREDIYQEISEGFLLSVILQWVELDPNSRKDHLLPALRLIRFPLIELEDLECLPTAVTKELEILDAIEEAKRYHLEIAKQCLKTEQRFLPRGARPVIAIMSFNEQQNVVLYKSPDEDDFVIEELAMAEISTDFESAGLATVGNFLFAVGGYDRLVVSCSRVFRFDPQTREWTEVASMNQPRVSQAICESDGRIFVFGGVDHQVAADGGLDMDVVLSSVEMYDAAENAWIQIHNLPTPSYNQAAAAAGDDLYVCGGISMDPLDPMSLVQAFKFSLASESWDPIQDMLTSHQDHNMTHVDGKLYVTGGYSAGPDGMFVDNMDNEMYDTKTGQWTKIMATPQTFGHIYQEAVVLDGLLYFVGGIEEKGHLHHYDIEADKMEEGAVIGRGIKKFCVLKVALP